MPPIIINGKENAARIENNCKDIIISHNLKPKLLIITTEEADPASKIYMRNKLKAAKRCGIDCEIYECPPNMTTKILLLKMILWNNDPSISGIIVQLPMPERFNIYEIQQAIDPRKDVDGFGEKSLFFPCTPDAIIDLLDHEQYPLDGKHCVVIGRSEIVGKPLARMLLNKNATVSQCHSHTPPATLKQLCLNADYIFCAAGVPNLIKPDYLTPNQTVVIDISINRPLDGKLCGDLHPDAAPLTKAYTPVPGGIGPLTVATLMSHTTMAALENLKKK